MLRIFAPPAPVLGDHGQYLNETSRLIRVRAFHDELFRPATFSTLEE